MGLAGEIWEYIGEGTVLVGVVLEVICERKLILKNDTEGRGRIEAAGGWVLVVGLCISFSALVGTNEYFNSTIAVLNAQTYSAIEAAFQNQSEFVDAVKAGAQLQKEAEDERLERIEVEAAYLMPRTVSPEQVDLLREYATTHGGQKMPTVTVEATPSDPEALAYAGQLFNALNSAGWKAEWGGIAHDGSASNPGLCLGDTGENSGIPNPNPVLVLEEAFRIAHIELSCQSGKGGGDYGVFVLVGHRPLTVGAASSRFSEAQWRAKGRPK
ncbi:MAG TPA: hypothetical protein VMT38_07740 [Terracidiphilus sp.]|nr:hypothetical protein [Terracidiphilus sp.]